MKEKLQRLSGDLRHLPDVWIGFFGYLAAHLPACVITAVSLVLIYAQNAFSNDYSVDSEWIINYPESLYGWDQVGRYGMVWLKDLLGLKWYNHYFAGALLLIALWFTAMATGYLFRRIDDRLSPALVCVFGLLYLIYPTYCEQFLFQIQACEVAIALFLLAVSDWYLAEFLREGRWTDFVVSLVPALISFGVYQTTVNMQMCLYLGMFLFVLYRTGEDGGMIRRSIGFILLHFAIAFAGYSFISKQFYTSLDYLSSQIQWGQEPVGTMIRTILYNVWMVVRGDDVFYTLSYTVFGCLFVLAGLVLIAEKKKRSIWYIPAAIALGASPFFLAIYTGTIIAYRIQLMLPLAGAIMWLFGAHYLYMNRERVKLRKIGMVIFAAAAMVFLYVNAATCMRLFYSHRVISRADEIASIRIIDELNQLEGTAEGKPVIFVGHRMEATNGSCYTLDDAYCYLLMSVYELDYQADPQYYHSTNRILGYYRTLGYDFTGPDSSQIEPAIEAAESMTVWPLEGSIEELDDFIVVKLSN